jgi:hypothetical protein
MKDNTAMLSIQISIPSKDRYFCMMYIFYFAAHAISASAE